MAFGLCEREREIRVCWVQRAVSATDGSWTGFRFFWEEEEVNSYHQEPLSITRVPNTYVLWCFRSRFWWNLIHIVFPCNSHNLCTMVFMRIVFFAMPWMTYLIREFLTHNLPWSGRVPHKDLASASLSQLKDQIPGLMIQSHVTLYHSPLKERVAKKNLCYGRWFYIQRAVIILSFCLLLSLNSLKHMRNCAQDLIVVVQWGRNTASRPFYTIYHASQGNVSFCC